MNSTLTQSLEWFFTALMVASIVGIASYVLLRWAFETWNEQLLYICALVAFCGGGLLLVLPRGNEGLIYGSALLLIWIFLAFVERAAKANQESWIGTFFKIAIATICAALFTLLLWAMGESFLAMLKGVATNDLMADQDRTWFTKGYVVGSLLSPAAIPISLWVWKTSQLRPSIDRHLHEGEVD